MKNFHLEARSARPSRGFTLIELMIAVAIVGILAAIALPAYRDSITKGKRAQARTALLDFAQSQERFFTLNNCYQTNTTAGLADASPSPNCPYAGSFKLYSGDTAASPAYKLQATATCGNGATQRDCVLLTAIPQAPFTDPQGGSLTLSTTGMKGCYGGTNPSVCWP